MKRVINRFWGWVSSQTSLWSVAFVAFFRPAYAKWYLGVAGALDLASWALAIVIKWYLGDKQVIMHSNILFGIDRIASAGAVFWLPAFGLIIIVANIILAYLLSGRKEGILPHLLLAGAVAVNLFVLMALGSIYRINYINIGK
ncbi:MAG: hypothetical protein WCO55_01890 [Candidatus Falkowbacteria bacterium]